MKKEYVKPVMESEEFVANEYVAACYQIYCKGFDGIAIGGRNDHQEDQYIGKRTSNQQDLENEIYQKNLSILFGQVSRSYPACTIDGKEHWQVEIRDVTRQYPGHPNASV